MFRLRVFVLPWLFFLILFSPQANAYSLLTHQQLIDLTWKNSIVPLLLSRYPNLTPAQLDEARAYAYGGCVIQDIGYYPLGDVSFSNLTHYVRSGDFVLNLFRNANNADELAFASWRSFSLHRRLGRPSQATNNAVPIEFPKLRAKYGALSNYAEGKHQHVQTEFAFDIDEIAHHRVAPVRFLRHIGLQVPSPARTRLSTRPTACTEDFSARRGRRFNVRGYRLPCAPSFPASLRRHAASPPS